MKKNVFQTNGGITINVNVNVKNVMYVKKIIFGILPHVVVKMENIYQVLWIIQRLCVMRLNFNEKKATHKTQNFYIFICIFINLHNINESC